MPADRSGVTTPASTWTVEDGVVRRGRDVLATEEPLEIRLVVGGRTIPVAVTMRTPGSDFELAVGFLLAENVVHSRDAIREISYCVDRDVEQVQRYNIVNVELASSEAVDLSPLERHFSVTSACGVCGKATLEALRMRGYAEPPRGSAIDPAVIESLPQRLRAAQAVFESTGGLHASGLFSLDGELVALREDVGRHNAMDKLIGWAVLAEMTPLAEKIVLVSGRSSFELVQKALSAGVGVLCSVSAPSSLAVDLAKEFGLTLIGFLRERRFQIYSVPERVAAPVGSGTNPAS